MANDTSLLDYDELARTYYAKEEYKLAALFGEIALEKEPGNERLKQNLRWYNTARDKRAYITLLSNDNYINGIVVLDKSLKQQNSKYLLGCIVTPDVSKENLEVLSRLNIFIIQRDHIVPPQYKDMPAKDINSLDERGWHRAMTKLSIYGLDFFSKLVYIDADIIVKQNIDELFDRPHMSACWDGGLDLGSAGFSGSFNSGLMVIEPNKKEYEEIIKFMENFDPQGSLIHDQLILQKFFDKWPKQEALHLSRYYAPWTTNFNPGYEDYFYYNRGNMKTLHMIDAKPWTKSKKYFFDLMTSYPFYAYLNLEYIDILNFTIKALESEGITSSYLKVIE